MSLGKLVKFIGLMTFLALVYIHLQMEIVNLAYKGKDKEKRIRELLEDNGNISYSILTLKSSASLGLKMLKEKSDMDFIDSENVMEIAAPVDFFKKDKKKFEKKDKDSKNILLSLLSFGKEASAEVNK